MTSTALVPAHQGVPTLEWRIVLRGFMNYDGLQVCTHPILNGVFSGTFFDLSSLTAENLHFTDDYRDEDLELYLDHTAYWLLVKVAPDLWMVVKPLTPWFRQAWDDYMESDIGPFDDDRYDLDEDTEDPLAGEVEPTGGYYEPPADPREAHLLSVMRQHGDYTGW